MTEHIREDGIPDDLMDEALLWLARLRDGDATDEQLQSFEAWRNGGEAQTTAWNRACDVWDKSGEIAAAFGPHVEAPETQTKTHEAEAPGLLTFPSPPVQAVGLTRRRWLQAAAASVVVAAPAYYLSQSGLLADHATGPGERKTVELPDRSRVELGTSSLLNVRFENGLRQLTLNKGEAFVAVRRGSGQPLTTDAGNGRVEADEGTLNIKHLAEATTVTALDKPAKVKLADGQAMTLDPARQVGFGHAGFSPVRDIKPAVVLAWRSDRIIFQNAPLAAVVADLERYRTGRIVIMDERLAKAPVTAVFKAQETDAAIETIAETLSINARRITPYLVLLSA